METNPESEVSQNDTPSSETVEQVSDKNRNKINLRLFMIIAIGVVIFLIVLLAAYGYRFVHTQIKQQAIELVEIEDKFSALQHSVDKDIEVFLSSRNEVDEALETIVRDQESIKNQVSSQTKRIVSMSTTSREDWLLAEAEYLIRLANQRVLVERNAKNAYALIEEADRIIRELGYADLYPLRQSLQEDLLALKLARTVDTDGIYFQINAIRQQVATIPTIPDPFTISNQSPRQDLASEETVLTSLERFLAKLKAYIRIENHKDKPAVLLAPQDSAYLQLNLRFMLEQAQIALLREQQNIYRQSLSEAAQWLDAYFPQSEVKQALVLEIGRLEHLDIVSELPDLADSLTLLQNYIKTLHLYDTSDKQESNTGAEG